MSAAQITLNSVTKKLANDGKPRANGSRQMNVRLENALLDEFDTAIGKLLPDPGTTSVVRMMVQAFVMDPEGFVALVKQFMLERREEPV